MENIFDSGWTGIGLLWIAVHLAGLLTSWLVRMHAGRRYELFAQGGFFTALLAVAVTTVIGHLCCLTIWPLSAVTLAVMVVLAIGDLGTHESQVSGLEG